MQDAIASYRQLITDNDGEIIHEENWGLTKLAYPIQKKVTGFYHIFEFAAPGDIITKLELAYRRDEQVMRYITLRLDKHALKYNERRRKGEFNKAKTENEVAK
jgi:small subunit ribosomal protein S6